MDFFRYAALFARDRVVAQRQMRKKFGPFSICKMPKPFPPLMVFVTGERFNREIFGQIDIWRTYLIDRHHKIGHASERLTRGLIRLPSGAQHKHYRKVIAPALSREAIDQAAGQIMQTAAAEVASWPMGETINFWDCVRHLMQVLAVATLFGNERSRGCPMARALNDVSQEMLSLRSLWCPVNLPGTTYNRMLKRAEKLERDIVDWFRAKRGETDSKDLMSLLANAHDEEGRPPDLNSIVGHVPALLGGAFESSQSSLFWTLLLLSQHPDIAARLADEVKDFDICAPDAAEALEKLPLLDGVVKEGMRLLPAVPMQARISINATSLAGFPVPHRTYAFVSAYCNNREPNVYDEPESFRPERWESIRPNQYQYLAFSAGARKCPGFWYGVVSVKIALLTIMKRFRVDFLPTIPIDHTVSVVMYPRRGALAVLRPQDRSHSPSRIRGTICQIMPLAS